jgi:hypothetical protein
MACCNTSPTSVCCALTVMLLNANHRLLQVRREHVPVQSSRFTSTRSARRNRRCHRPHALSAFTWFLSCLHPPRINAHYIVLHRCLVDECSIPCSSARSLACSRSRARSRSCSCSCSCSRSRLRERVHTHTHTHIHTHTHTQVSTRPSSNCGIASGPSHQATRRRATQTPAVVARVHLSHLSSSHRDSRRVATHPMLRPAQHTGRHRRRTTCRVFAKTFVWPQPLPLQTRQSQSCKPKSRRFKTPGKGKSLACVVLVFGAPCHW